MINGAGAQNFELPVSMLICTQLISSVLWICLNLKVFANCKNKCVLFVNGFKVFKQSIARRGPNFNSIFTIKDWPVAIKDLRFHSGIFLTLSSLLQDWQGERPNRVDHAGQSLAPAEQRQEPGEGF
jgi:hypothetical protein